MMSRKRKIAILLTVCLLTIGFASIYATNGADGDVFDDLRMIFQDLQGGLQEHTEEIEELRALVEALEPGGETVWEAIMNNADDIDTIEDDLQTHSDWIHGNKDDIAELVIENAALQESIDFLTLKHTSDMVFLQTQHAAHIAALQTQIDTVQAYASSTQLDVTMLEGTVGELEGYVAALGDSLDDALFRIAALEAIPPGLGAPLYDSGWIDIAPNSAKTICTLDNPNVFVYMIGRMGGIVHQLNYGGDRYYPTESLHIRGARWEIKSNNQLEVYRKISDPCWEKVRVLVWQLQTP